MYRTLEGREGENRPLRGVRKRFGDLRVRHKLIILHNVFFLILSIAVYFSVLWALGPEGVRRVRWALAAALAGVYAVGVILLETVILPLYVYRPLRLLLEADDAAHRGDGAGELIDPALIPRDEVGQIMASRNTTIAELRRHEEDLKRKNALLEAAKRSLAEQDRLASLGMLNASVAHELNTPLAVLQGSIEKMLETAAPGSAVRERLARMKRVAERLQRISETLLDFARAGQIQREPVEVRQIVEEAWALTGIDEKAASVRFRNEVAPGIRVTGDGDRLAQVFVNLLRNALNVVGQRGEIAVRSEVWSADSRIAIFVEDDGPGIPPEILPQIFDAFVTSRLDARCTGLGLAVAEGIVEQHGGSIRASNRPSGGAQLEVVLPLAPEINDERGAA